MTTKTDEKIELIEVEKVDPDQPTMTLEVIDPELAGKYLNMSAPNRHIRPGVVTQYARDMLADKWHSSVIRFAKDGQLWDGQHRLKAITVSKTEQLFWVERNVPIEAVHSIDVGIKRSMGDMLSIAGESNANNLAASIRIASHLETLPGTTPSSWGKTPMSVDEMFDYLDKNPDIRHSIRIGEGFSRGPQIVPASLATALHYLEMKISRPYATEFWNQMTSGAEIKEYTGPWALRNLLIEDRLRPKGTRMDMNMLYAVCIKAWNFWQYDHEIKQLRWLRGADEPFPKLGQRPK